MFNIHSTSCSGCQWRRNQRELRVVSLWEEGQQGESDHKCLLECNQHGKDASEVIGKANHVAISVVDHVHQLFT